MIVDTSPADATAPVDGATRTDSTAEADPAIRLSGVSKVYRSGRTAVAALDRIELEVPKHGFTCLVGASGCGKTTLLNLVAGLDQPTAGDVAVVGRAGLMFQESALFPWLTVADNIAFGLREKGLPKEQRSAAVREWLGRIGLTGFEHHYPKQLSGGMQQRTAIARALANEPAILLLDEPFGALDNQTRALMQELLLRVWERERKTVLFVTHDIEEAIFLGSRVLVMTARPGRIKAEVTVDLPHPRHYTIKTSPEFSALKARLTEEIRVEAVLAAENAAGAA